MFEYFYKDKVKISLGKYMRIFLVFTISFWNVRDVFIWIFIYYRYVFFILIYILKIDIKLMNECLLYVFKNFIIWKIYWDNINLGKILRISFVVLECFLEVFNVFSILKING